MMDYRQNAIAPTERVRKNGIKESSGQEEDMELISLSKAAPAKMLSVLGRDQPARWWDAMKSFGSPSTGMPEGFRYHDALSITILAQCSSYPHSVVTPTQTPTVSQCSGGKGKSATTTATAHRSGGHVIRENENSEPVSGSGRSLSWVTKSLSRRKVFEGMWLISERWTVHYCLLFLVYNK